jgi:anti-anti-sigma factor
LAMMDVGAIGDTAIVRVTEEIDFVSAPRLEHIIKTVELAHPGRVVISLEDCRYCDSICLGIVLRAASRIGPRLGVVVPPGTIARRLFEVTGMANQPFVFGTLDDALATRSSL